MIKLSIVVLSFNTKDLTCSCLQSILLQYEKELKNEEFEIILVDNASNDETVKTVSALKIPNLKIIQNKENEGFSKGNNLGAKNATGKFIIFLNSDTEIKDKGFLRMTEFMELNERVGILGGRLQNENKSFQKSAGTFINIFNLGILLFGGGKLGLLTKSPLRITKIDWVSGASMMVRKKIFENIGGFEERLFMYMEDMELCYRARLKGFLTYFYPDISLLHKERGSSNKTFAIVNIHKGILYFFKKYKPGWQYETAHFMLSAKSKLLVIIGKMLNNKYLVETYSETLKL